MCDLLRELLSQDHIWSIVTEWLDFKSIWNLTRVLKLESRYYLIKDKDQVLTEPCQLIRENLPKILFVERWGSFGLFKLILNLGSPEQYLSLKHWGYPVDIFTLDMSDIYFLYGHKQYMMKKYGFSRTQECHNFISIPNDKDQYVNESYSRIIFDTTTVESFIIQPDETCITETSLILPSKKTWYMIEGTQLTEFLIQLGFEVNSSFLMAFIGRASLLENSMICGKIQLVEKLLDWGAHGNDSITNLFYLAAKWDRFDMVKKLVKNGGGSKQRFLNYHPLIVATKNGNLDMVQFLIDHKCELNSLRINNPLQVAVRQNNVEMAKLLIRNGADTDFWFDTGDGSYDSPLISAIKNKNSDMVDLLLKNGAQVDFRDDNSNRTFCGHRLAKDFKNEEVIQLVSDQPCLKNKSHDV